MAAAPSFKQRLHSGAVQYGFMVNAPAPATVEIAGHTGFDFVIIDNEHGAIGIETVEHMLRAAEASGIHALVRVPGARPEHILHVLDAGAEGVVVPHVDGAAQAAEIVARAYYPPLGRRGVSAIARAARHGAMPAAAFLKERAERTAVVAMIEDAKTLPEVEAIAAMAGIDALFVGANDLAASMGHLDEPGHADVLAAVAGIRATLERLAARRSPARSAVYATLAASAEQARAHAASGAKMVIFNTSFVLLNALKALRSQLDASG